MLKNITFWQLIVFVLGLLLVLTIREYLLDKNEIVANIGRMNCMVEMEKVGLQNNLCEDIRTYKLKSQRFSEYLGL